MANNTQVQIADLKGRFAEEAGAEWQLDDRIVDELLAAWRFTRETRAEEDDLIVEEMKVRSAARPE